MIDRQAIAARKTEKACGNFMHLLVEFSLLSYASLNKLAVQLFAWLRVFASARSNSWPVSTQYDAMSETLILHLLIAAHGRWSRVEQNLCQKCKYLAIFFYLF